MEKIFNFQQMFGFSNEKEKKKLFLNLLILFFTKNEKFKFCIFFGGE
jgi:hypothetical protein